METPTLKNEVIVSSKEQLMISLAKIESGLADITKENKKSQDLRFINEIADLTKSIETLKDRIEKISKIEQN